MDFPDIGNLWHKAEVEYLRRLIGALIKLLVTKGVISTQDAQDIIIDSTKEKD